MHTFYEAVGYMIGAQTDQAVQEHLIEKYMLLPNQVWDSIIQQATKVRRLAYQKLIKLIRVLFYCIFKLLGLFTHRKCIYEMCLPF